MIRRQSPTIVVGILFAILTVVWYHGSREDGNNVGKHEEHQTITPLDHSTVHDPRQPAVAKMHDGQDTAAVVVRQVIDSNRILVNRDIRCACTQISCRTMLGKYEACGST